MALRAGYYGLKSIFAKKINRENIIPTNAGKTNPLITMDRYMQLQDFVEITGSRNILPPSPIASRTDQGITFTCADDGTITLSGNNTGTSAAVLRYNVTLQPGVYRLWGRLSSTIWTGLFDGTKYVVSTTNADGVLFTIDSTVTYGFTLRVGGPQEITPALSMIAPMITDSYDPDVSNTFAPYAQTNRYLTLENIDQAGALDDHKTAINAIIAAATGAADFAAFKTAMGALTPVTRSAPAAIQEEPEPVTKKSTTKKSTNTEEV